MRNRYYREELEYLRELGRAFAREHPTLAPALAEAGSDPDVERVLEGTAFLTGAVREKLEDELPEITQTLLQMLWPHYLRPVPATTVLEFQHPARPKVAGTARIPRGETEVESVPVDGTPCRFRTVFDVAFHPLRIAEARLEGEGRGALRLRLELLPGAKPEELALDPLRLHLHGELAEASTLRLWLLRHLREVALEVGAGSRRTRERVLPGGAEAVRPAGFDTAGEALFPYPPHAFEGYRLLQEYFTLPQKLLFLDVHGLGALAELEPETGFDLVFRFAERPPESLRVSAESLRLHCTPAVNLTARDAEPIRLDHRRSRYLLRPADPEPDHFEVYSVDRVVGVDRGSTRAREYASFFSFQHGTLPGEERTPFYKLTRRPAVGKPNSDCYLGFASEEAEAVLPAEETVSCELTCTNRRLPEGLKPGDVARHTDRSPPFADFRNLGAPTPSIHPPLEGGLAWRLVAHLAASPVSLASAETLRSVLGLYDFRALTDRQAARASALRLEGLAALRAAPEERVFRGTPLRGMHTEIELLEERFASEGELHLFASVLEAFLALYVSINAFSRVTVRGRQKGEVYAWPPRVGTQLRL